MNNQQTPEAKIYVPKSSAKLKSKNDLAIGEALALFRGCQQGQRLILALSFHADTLAAFATEKKNSRGYVNLNVTVRQQDGPYGDQFSVWLDTWEPKAKADAPTAAKGFAAAKAANAAANDDVPF